MEQVAVQVSKPFPLRTKFSWALNAEEQDVQPVAQADPYFIVMEGWMHKKASLSKSWRNRWFVLKSDCKLYFYRKKWDKICKGLIDINSISEIQQIEKNEYGEGYQFEIVTPSRVYQLIAPSENARREWMKAIAYLALGNIRTVEDKILLKDDLYFSKYIIHSFTPTSYESNADLTPPNGHSPDDEYEPNYNYMVDQFKYDDHYYGLNNFVENGWHVSRYQAPEYLSQNNETNGFNPSSSNGNNPYSEDNTTFENSEDDESLGSIEDRSTNGSHSSRSIGSANGHYNASGHPTTGHHRNRSLSSGGVFEDPDLEDELAINNSNGEQSSWPQVYQCEAPHARVWRDFHQLNMQTMTCVGWINFHLGHLQRQKVKDLKDEFTDGVNLIYLAEALINEDMPRFIPHPKTNVDKVQNINLAIKLLKDRLNVDLTCVNTSQIVNGNVKTIMDLIWQIAYQLYIKPINFCGLNDRFALLAWCQDQTHGYEGVNVTNFTTSFQDGLALCAILHSFNSNSLAYHTLVPYKKMDNLRLAFKTAKELYKVPQILDPKDFTEEPDEISIIMYLSMWFHLIN
jgi:hypothetical protein